MPVLLGAQLDVAQYVSILCVVNLLVDFQVINEPVDISKIVWMVSNIVLTMKSLLPHTLKDP